MPSHPHRSSLRTLARLAAGTALVAALVALPEAAEAKGKRGAVNPLTKHVSALQVGPGHEFRLLVVHPLHAPDTFVGPENVRAAQSALPDTVGFRAPSGGRSMPLRLDNLIEERLVAFPGQIVRSDRFDLALTDHVVVGKRAGTVVPLEYISTAAPADEPRPERRVLDTWLPPTLRFAVGPDAPPRDLQDTLRAWARDGGLESGRISMADLGRTELLKERVADYVRALGTLSRAPAGLQTVGYAAVLDGEPLVVETFADGKWFADHWTALIQALAVEAAVLEAREEVIEEEIAATGEPDRFLGAVRELLLTFYRSEPQARSARQEGEILEVATPLGTLRALVLDRTSLTHLTLVTDPRRRSTSEELDFDPGAISRKRRPTQAEERWLDRRKKNPNAPPIPQPGPTPPEIEFPPKR